MRRAITAAITLGAALSLAACASDNPLSTAFGSSEPTAALPAKPAVDPACATLASRIDALKQDGVVDRVNAAAQGKGSTVTVKRSSLSQIAELEKANAEFQSKCSTIPRAAAATVPPPAAPAAVKAKDARKTAMAKQAVAENDAAKQ